MPAAASLEELKEAYDKMPQNTKDNPILRWLREYGPRIGWKNCCHMLVYFRSPEELKGLRQ